MIPKFTTLVSAPKILLGKYQAHLNNARLTRITDEVRTRQFPQTTKVLLGPSFSIYHTLKIHDVLLASLLRAQGADLTYASIPYGLPACLACGGVNQLLKPSRNLCAFCQRFQRNEKNLIEHIGTFARCVSLDYYEGADAVPKIELEPTRLEQFEIDSIPIGRYAVDVLRNLGYVGDVTKIPDYQEKLREVLTGQCILFRFLKKTLDELQPDIIISHDAFYAPWRFLLDLARQRHIPFYNYYPGLRHNTFHYAKDKPTMELDVSALYDRWKNQTIKAKELKKLDPLFARRKKGKIYSGQLTWVGDSAERKAFEALMAHGKPTAVLYGNVLWDLTALNKDTVYSSLQESVIETVRFFAGHPEYNLIVKPHPGELIADHESREKLTDLVRSKFPSLPENILVLHPQSSITAYDLINKSGLSIVYTTTAGVESVILGTPTITLGLAHYRNKGFTYDPATQDDYFALIPRILKGERRAELARQQDLAEKYYYLYFFVYLHDFNIVKFNLLNKTKVVPRSLDDLLKNQDFNRLVDAIMQKQEIPYFDEGIEETRV